METDNESQVIEIESFCINCGKNGMTKVLPTRLPFYKEVIVISFECTDCGFRNNELHCGSKIPPKGVRYELQVGSISDLNRTIIRSDYTSINIPHLQFEIPANSHKGDITTLEGIIDRAISGLKLKQEDRRKQVPKVADQIDEVLQKLERLKDVETPFTVIIEDISGICRVSNPNGPNLDPALKSTVFVRTKEQNHMLGIFEPGEINDDNESSQENEPFTDESVHSEVLHIADNCPNCGVPCPVNMKVQSIPHFKEVIIMALNCDKCGIRTNEVKSGSGIEEKGMKITVTVSDMDDFSRDVLKSDTCVIMIPEIEVEVGAATMSGRFTTVEGILVTIKEQLQNGHNMFTDSANPNENNRMNLFIEKLNNLLTGKSPFTLILDDPAGNSFVQSLTPPDPDSKLKIEHYERSFQQNEDLGLNDMKVENYE